MVAPRLVLLLDLGTRLTDFARLGTLERELAVYRRLQRTGVPVTVVSWARGEDAEIAERIHPLQVQQNAGTGRNRLWVLRCLWSLLAPGDGATVVLTNQITGAELAVPVCLLRRRPLIVRCGYLRSENVARAAGPWSWAALAERVREAFVATFATYFLVSAEEMRYLLERRYPWLRGRVHVLPNYVDETVFRPKSRTTPEGQVRRIVFAGRLAPEKNLELLVRSVARLPDISLTLIGSGDQRATLERIVGELGAPVTFEGTVENEELPERYRDADVFALLSRYEGNPKALLEAMACGLCVLGANVSGIATLVTHGRNGVLVNPEVDAVIAAIEWLHDPSLRNRMGVEARRTVLANNSLEAYTRQLGLILDNAAGRGAMRDA